MLVVSLFLSVLTTSFIPAKCGVDPAGKWAKAVAAVRHDQSLRGDAKSTSEVILRIRELDIQGRASIEDIWPIDLSHSEFEECQEKSGVIGLLRQLDEENSTKLKLVFPKSGWFDAKRYGYSTEQAAWFIVQHSPDKEFQAMALSRMTPSGHETSKELANYALLFDRVRLGRGEPQRFGSQGECRNGKVGIYNLEDPAGVDLRRKKFGLPSLREYKKLLGVGGPCG